MKKQNKAEAKKMTISQFTFGAIKAKSLHKDGSKEALMPLVNEVRKKFSGTKFSLAHAQWYVSRYRRQLKDGLAVDKLHQLKPSKPAKKVAKKATAKKSAKKSK